MSEDGYKFQTTFKHGRNASIMTNVRGDNPDEFGENLTLLKNEFAELIGDTATVLQAAETVQDAFPGAEPVQEQQPRYGANGRPSGQGGYQPQRQGGYQRGGGGQQQQGGGNGAPCNHGVPRKYISGTSKKTGKPYAMWVCVVENDPNSPQCQAVFV